MEISLPLMIKVKPNSKKQELLFDEINKIYVLRVRAKPEDNKANAEVIKFFSRLLKKKVCIAHGLRSREKIIDVV